MAEEEPQTLFSAVARRDISAVEKLLKSKSDPNSLDELGRSPLLVAAQANKGDIVEVLLHAHADINQRDKEGATALHHVCLNPSAAGLGQILLEAGALVDARTYNDGLQPLHSAAVAGNARLASHLLSSNADPNVPTLNGDAALIIAVESGSSELVSLLCRSGANPTVRDADGNSAADVARELNDGALTQVLTVAEEEWQQRFVPYGSISELSNAAAIGDVAAVMRNMQHKLSPEDLQHPLPVAMAAKHGQRDVLGFLLQKGAAATGAVDADGTSALHLASRFSVDTTAMEMVQSLLAFNADPNTTNCTGTLPIHSAVGVGNAGVVRLLSSVAGGSAHIDAPDGEGQRPLHIAATMDQEQAARVLVELGANTSALDRMGRVASQVAAARGSRGVANVLRQAANKATPPEHLEKSAVLLAACEQGNLEKVDQLLSDGASVDFVDANGASGLHAAAKAGYPLVLKVLLKSGAKFSLDYDSRSPLHAACECKDPEAAKEVVSVLLGEEHGPAATTEKTRKDQFLPLHVAIANGKASLVSLLLQLPNAATQLASRMSTGETALHMAARSGMFDVVQALLSAGADPSRPTSQGRTAAELAKQAGHDGVAMTILGFGRDGVATLPPTQAALAGQASSPQSQDVPAGGGPRAPPQDSFYRLLDAIEGGSVREVEAQLRQDSTVVNHWGADGSPLSFAASFGDPNILKVLLDAGADPNLADGEGMTALHHAAALEDEPGNLDCAKVLLGARADPSARTKKDVLLPAHHATLFGTPNLALLLLQAMPLSDIDSATSSGDTVLHLAACRGLNQVCSWLLSQGVSVNTANCDGMTPYQCAMEQGHTDLAQTMMPVVASAQRATVPPGETDEELLSRIPETVAPSPAAAKPPVVTLDAPHDHIPDVCDSCGKTEGPMVVCSRCRRVKYCSEDCQRRGWPSHQGPCAGSEATKLGQDTAALQDLASGAPEAPVDTASLIVSGDVEALKVEIDAHRFHVNAKLDTASGVHAKYPLLLAGSVANSEMVRIFLQLGADVNAVDDAGATALHWTCAGEGAEPQKFATASLLCKANPDFSLATRDEHLTPLHSALFHRQFAIVEHLLKIPQVVETINQRTSRGDVALHVAAGVEAPLHIMNSLLQCKGSPNITNNEGATAIDVAANHGFKAIHKVLLAQALPSLADSIRSGDITALKAVLEYEKVNDELPADQLTPLCLAASLCNESAVKVLLSHKAEVLQHSGGASALHWACRGPAEPALTMHSVVETLLDAKADSNATTDSDGVTPLMIASQRGLLPVVELLLKQRPSLNASTDGGDTALHLAAAAGVDISIPRALIVAGANSSAVNGRGFKFVDVVPDPKSEFAKELRDLVRKQQMDEMFQAIKLNDVPQVQKLVKTQEFDLNELNNRGEACLGVAAALGYQKMVTVLLTSKASPTLQDKAGYTALHYASASGHDASASQIVELLVNGGGRCSIAAANEDGFFPVHKSVLAGHQKATETIVELHPPSVDIRSIGKGLAPLHIAAEKGDTDMIRLLLELGGNAAARSTDGMRPLEVAHLAQHREAAKVLQHHTPHGEQADPASMASSLFAAAMAGRSEMTAELLASKADVNCRRGDSVTALILAAFKGHETTLEILLHNAGDVNASDESGATPLHYASAFSDDVKGARMVEVLLEFGEEAAVKTTKPDQLTPLHSAVVAGNTRCVKTLLQHISPEAANARTALGDTALHVAAGTGAIDIAEALLDYRAFTETQNAEGATPLIVAVSMGHSDIVQLLVSKGADANAANTDGTTPIHHAIMNQDEASALDLVRVLVEHGRADPTKRAGKDEVSPLHTAVVQEYVSVVEYFLSLPRPASRGTDTRTRGGETSMHLAASQGSTAITETLIRHGADVNAVDAEGLSVVEHAAVACGPDSEVVSLLKASPDFIEKDYGVLLMQNVRKGDAQEVQHLLEQADTDLDKLDGMGDTPLGLATRMGLEPIVSVLIEARADVNTMDANAYTALHHAASLSDHEVGAKIGALLLESGSDPRLATVDLVTPLHIASVNDGGNIALIESILATPAVDVNQMNQAGDTALHWAASLGHGHVVLLLLRAGADQNIVNADEQTAFILAANGHHQNVIAILESAYDENEDGAVGELPSQHGVISQSEESAGLPRQELTPEVAALVLAIHEGDHMEVSRLIRDEGVDANCSDEEFTPVLLVAASFGHEQVMATLVESGADINAQDSSGNTALHCACCVQPDEDAVRAVRFLVEVAKANLNAAVGPFATAPLHIACIQGNEAVVRYLLGRSELDMLAVTQHRDTALHCAAGGNNFGVIKALIAAGMPIGVRNAEGLTPLNVAEGGDCAEAAELLRVASAALIEYFKAIENNLGSRVDELLSSQLVTVHATNHNGVNAICIAAQRGRAEAVASLLHHGANPDEEDVDGSTPAHLAASSEFDSQGARVLRLLCNAGGNMMARVTDMRLTPLHLGALQGNAEVVRFLTSLPQVEVNVQTKLGDTALHCASAAGHAHVAETLLLSGADPTLKNSDSMNAALLAKRAGFSDVVRHFIDLAKTPLQTPASRDSKDAEVEEAGWEQPTEQQQKRNNQLLAAIIKNDAAQVGEMVNTAGLVNPNCFNEEGASAIMVAVELGHVEIAKLLLEFKADPSMPHQSDGATTLHRAAAKTTAQNLQLLPLLLKHIRPSGLASRTSADTSGFTPLHSAVSGNNSVAVETIASALVGGDQQALLNATNELGDSPLHLAAITGAHRCAKALVEARADIMQANRNGQTALEVATQAGQTETAEALRSAEEAEKARRTDALRQAVKSSDAETVQQLLDQGHCQVSGQGSDGSPLICEAADRGDAKIIELLLRAGAHIDEKDAGGYAALHTVCRVRKLEPRVATSVAETLLDAKASPNLAGGAEGGMPLHFAARRPDAGLTTLLLDQPKGLATLHARTSRGDTPLHSAAAAGSTDNINVLLRAKASPVAINSVGTGLRPLEVAVEMGHDAAADRLRGEIDKMGTETDVALIRAVEANELVAVTSLLNAQTSNPNCVRPSDGATVLGVALHCADDHIVRALVEANAEPAMTNGAGRTSLHVAVELEDTARATSRTALVLTDRALSGTDMTLRTPLHLAVRRRSVDLVRVVLSGISTHGLDVEGGVLDMADSDGDTALHLAARFGDLEIVSLLLRTAANRLATNHQHQTPLDVAKASAPTDGSFAELIDVLEKAVGEDIAAANNDLVEEIRHGRTESVQGVLRRGHANVNHVFTEEGAGAKTPLRVAAESGAAAIVDLLLEAKADVEWKDDEAVTALHAACGLGAESAVEIVKKLLWVGAPVDAIDARRQTALHRACAQDLGHVALGLAQVLVDDGLADTSLQDDEGATPLVHAVRANNISTVEYLANALTEQRRVLNVPLNTGATPLAVAAGLGHGAIVRTLLNARADPARPDNEGKTAADVAAENDRAAVAELLREASGSTKQQALAAAVDAIHRDDGLGLMNALAQLHGSVSLDTALEGTSSPPLCVAAAASAGRAVGVLLDAKASVDVADKGHRNAMHLAAAGADDSQALDIVRMLAVGSGLKLALKHDNEGLTPLHHALAQNNVQTAMFFLSLGEEYRATNATTLNMDTPLHLAAECGSVEATQMLLSCGADPDVLNDRDHRPVDLAANADVAQVLKDAMLVAKIKRHEPFFAAVWAGTVSQVLRLLATDMYDINCPDKDGKPALVITALRGDHKLAAALLRRGATPDSTDGDGWTALAHAANAGEEHQVDAAEVTKLLLENGADPALSGGHDRRTALHRALARGNARVIALLLQPKPARQTMVNLADADGTTALHIAAQLGKSEMVESLLEADADPTVRDKKGSWPHDLAHAAGSIDLAESLKKRAFMDETRQTLEAAAEGDVERLRTAVDRGSSVDLVDEKGMSLLMLSATAGKSLTVSFLVQRGANIGLVSPEDNWTALHYAAACPGGSDVVGCLLTEGHASTYVLTREQHLTPLHLAARLAHVESVALLLRGRDYRRGAETTNKETPLHLAAASTADVEDVRAVLRLLLGRGENPQAKNDRGLTPFDVALDAGRDAVAATLQAAMASGELSAMVLQGNLSGVTDLLNTGVDPNVASSGGEPPLCAAAANGNLEIVRALLRGGAEAKLSDEDGLTALHHACALEDNPTLSYGLTKELLPRADPTAASNSGLTALHCAAGAGLSRTVKLLLGQPAVLMTLDLRSGAGDTPLHIAVRENRGAVIGLLVAAGARMDEVDAWGRTPLELARQMGTGALEGLLQESDEESKMVNVALWRGNASLLRLAQVGTAREVETCLTETPCDVACMDEDSATPLLLAAPRLDSDVLKTILLFGADTNAALPATGETPLHLICSQKADSNVVADCVGVLLRASADASRCSHPEGELPLHRAVLKGHGEAIRLLLQAFPGGMEAKTAAGENVLHIVARIGARELAEQLRPSAGALLKVTNAKGLNPFGVAVAAQHDEIARLFDDRTGGGKQERMELSGHEDSSALSPSEVDLLVAVAAGNVHHATECLRQDANVNCSGDNGMSPLMIAASMGHKRLHLVRFLLANGALPNLTTEATRTTALHHAATAGDLSVVKALVEVGRASVSLATANGQMLPLHLAVKARAHEVVEYLLPLTSQRNARTWRGDTPMHLAVANGDVRMVALLLKMRESPCKLNEGSVSPLSLALTKKADECIPLLHTALRDKLFFAAANGKIHSMISALRSGANINDRDADQGTALMAAAARGQAAAVARLLQESEVDVNACDAVGATALHHACSADNAAGALEVCVMLVAAGADDVAVTDDEITPLHAAVLSGHAIVAEYFVSRNLQLSAINQPTRVGDSALHLAASCGFVHIGRLLVLAGADVALRNGSGLNAIQLAEACGNKEMVQVLQAAALRVSDAKFAVDADGVVAAVKGSLQTGDVQRLLGLLNNSVDPNVLVDGITALRLACTLGRMRCASALLAHGAFVDECDDDGVTAMHDAAGSMANTGVSGLETVKLLCDSGASIELKTTNAGLLPVHCAVLAKDVEVTAFLLDRAPDHVNVQTNTEGDTCLLIAAASRNPKLVQTVAHRENVDPWKVNASGLNVLDVARSAMCNEVTEIIESLCMSASSKGLFQAIEDNRAREVEELLVSGHAQPDIVNFDNATPLMVASWMGHVDIVEILLRYGASAGKANADGSTALHYAASFANPKVATEMARMLLSAGAKASWTCGEAALTPLHSASIFDNAPLIDVLLSLPDDARSVDGMTSDGDTALHIAAGMGHVDSARLLVLAGADVMATNANGQTPLDMAVKQNNPTLTDLLQNAKIRSLEEAENAKQAAELTAMNNRDLFSAAEEGVASKVIRLLEGGLCDPNARDGAEATPMMVAASFGHLDVIEALLARGGNPLATDAEGTTALHLAAGLEDDDAALTIVKLLTEYHRVETVSRAGEDGLTPLHNAIISGNMQTISFLTELEPSERRGIEAETGRGDTPLIVAAAQGSVDAVRILLDAKANPLAVNHDKLSASETAALAGQDHVASVLNEASESLKAHNAVLAEHNAAVVAAVLAWDDTALEASLSIAPVDANASDDDDFTALAIAASIGNASAAKILLGRGADVNKADGQVTPLHCVTSVQDEAAVAAVIDVLLEGGAKLGDAVGDDLLTPLHAAILADNASMVGQLLSYGRTRGEVDTVTARADTPLHLAVAGTNVGIVKKLIAAGPNLRLRNDAGQSIPEAVNKDVPGIAMLIRSALDRDAAGLPPLPDALLFTALSNRDVTQVESLLDSGLCDVNARDEKGSCPLHLAARKGQLDMASTLLARDADTTLLDADGQNALHLTLALDNVTQTAELVRLLVGAGVLSSASRPLDQRTPLHLAGDAGNSRAMAALLAAPRELLRLDATDASDSTALHLAAKGGYHACVELLVDAGARCDVVNKDGKIPGDLAREGTFVQCETLIQRAADEWARRRAEAQLSLLGAARDGDVDTMASLLDEVAGLVDIDAPEPSEGGRSALLVAVAAGQSEATRLLLERGANVQHRDVAGYTALHLLSEAPDDQTAAAMADWIVKDFSADVFVKSWGSSEQMTPLHRALQEGREALARALLRLVASEPTALDLRNAQGDTFLHVAAAVGVEALIQPLVSAGCDTEATNATGRTASQVAFDTGHEAVGRALEAARAAMEEQDQRDEEEEMQRRENLAAVADAVERGVLGDVITALQATAPD